MKESKRWWRGLLLCVGAAESCLCLCVLLLNVHVHVGFPGAHVCDLGVRLLAVGAVYSCLACSPSRYVDYREEWCVNAMCMCTDVFSAHCVFQSMNVNRVFLFPRRSRK